MLNKWDEIEAERFLADAGKTVGDDLAFRTYSSRLLGSDPALVLHGGGNTSVKTTWVDVFGTRLDVLYVKASGYDLATIPPTGHTGLLLQSALRLLALETMTEQQMVDELRRCLLDWRSSNPSIEALMHAAIPAKYVDHTHADAILALTNQNEPEPLVQTLFGEEIAVLPYVKAGFELARSVSQKLAGAPGCQALILVRHGVVTWGQTARESYERMIRIVDKAEQYLESRRARVFLASNESVQRARSRYREIAPILRGCLAAKKAEQDDPYNRVLLSPLITAETLGLIESGCATLLASTPPLTPDHLIRTKALPLLIEPVLDDPAHLHDQVQQAVRTYSEEYDRYFERHKNRLAPGVEKLDGIPRVIILPGVGIVCAGEDADAADICRDITEQTVKAKAWFAATGTEYVGLGEEHLFDMEYFPLQHAKLARSPRASLGRKVALVTGAAGAIGLGVCETLLEAGCHLAVTDLAGESLDTAARELATRYPRRVIGVALDVTEADSVRRGFGAVIEQWGGVDLLIANAGIAMVSSLAEMSLDGFRKLERVNIEGTLLMLAEASRHFRLQNTGGDIVLVSTKNVFAPGAKFGAYSATKAASHQLARIASLELADADVRVNMVAPDAVFSHGDRKSGLWAEVGPDRMKARGLDEKGLEEYYRSRNLLKARITAEHVGRAVLYFATRQTPTTGATIPVDGGLPEATPR